MKTLYLDCGMGAAGDMLTAALLELMPDKEQILAELNALGIPGVTYSMEPSVKCGITGTHVSVMVNGEEESEEMHNGHHEHPDHIHEHFHGHEHPDHCHEHFHDHEYPDHIHEHFHGHEHPDHCHEHFHDHEHPDHIHEHFHDHEHPDHIHEHFHDHEHPDHCHGPFPAHEHPDHCHEHFHDHEHSDHIHEPFPDHVHPDHIHAHFHEHDHLYMHIHSRNENGDAVHEHHHHSGMHEIEAIIAELPLSEKVKSDICAVYALIAEAESAVHGVPVPEIHFHEVGTADAIADVTAVCMLMDKLSPEQVIVSPVHVGSGQVKCAHGILPVPAPATAFILRDVPIYGGTVRGELCTPTGAALLKHFAAKFGDMPVMKVQAIGYGMGKKDFERANCVRALFGESPRRSETVVELCCNLDDMTAEAVGFAGEEFLNAGALDFYVISSQMKKNRPGYLLTVMCKEADKEKLISLIFRHTTTLGIRESISSRYTLTRTIDSVETEFGEVHIKHAAGYGSARDKIEYDDLARIAREQGMSLYEVRQRIEKNL